MSSQRRDIAVCGYIHSGVDWLEKIVRCITNYLQTNNQSDLRIIRCTNTVPTSFPGGWFTSKNKILFILRNPKDIVSVSCSIEGDSGKDFSSFLEDFVSNRSQDPSAISWFDHTVTWGNFLITLPADMVLVVHFEDLVRNLGEELCKICTFLGVSYNENTLMEWCETLSIEEFAQINGPVRKRRKMENGSHCTNTDVIYETGVWRRLFTVGQSEAFDAFMRTKMANSAINIDKYL